MQLKPTPNCLLDGIDLNENRRFVKEVKGNDNQKNWANLQYLTMIFTCLSFRFNKVSPPFYLRYNIFAFYSACETKHSWQRKIKYVWELKHWLFIQSHVLYCEGIYNDNNEKMLNNL